MGEISFTAQVNLQYGMLSDAFLVQERFSTTDSAYMPKG